MNIASRLNRIMGGQGVRKSKREPAHQERGSRKLYQETRLAKMAEIVYDQRLRKGKQRYNPWEEKVLGTGIGENCWKIHSMNLPYCEYTSILSEPPPRFET